MLGVQKTKPLPNNLSEMTGDDIIIDDKLIYEKNTTNSNFFRNIYSKVKADHLF